MFSTVLERQIVIPFYYLPSFKVLLRRIERFRSCNLFCQSPSTLDPCFRKALSEDPLTPPKTAREIPLLMEDEEEFLRNVNCTEESVKALTRVGLYYS